jgi:uncharacterized iron-regulated membrane protein
MITFFCGVVTGWVLTIVAVCTGIVIVFDKLGEDDV